MRFRMTRSFHFGSQKVSGGQVIVDSAANALAGDVVWGGLNANTVPQGAVALDASATTAYGNSRYAGVLPPCTISGVDSIS
jgi:hypothetical protein